MSGIYSQVGVAMEVLASQTSNSYSTTAGTPNVAQLGFAAPHGLRVGDSVTLAGYTPSTWNGVVKVASVPSTTTFTFYTAGASVLANLTVHGTAVGTNWGVAQTPSHFCEFVSETLKSNFDRIESKTLRGSGATSNRVQRTDRFSPNPKGSTGDLTLEVFAKGFAYWLEPMFGTAPTKTGPADTVAYTYTSNIGDTTGKSATIQVGRPYSVAGFVQPFTYKGCKVASWELNCDTDGILMLKLSFVGLTEVLSTPLATASYPTNNELFTFAGGAITIGGTSFPVVTKASVKGNNGLATDRRFLGGTIGEALDAGMRQYTWEITTEFNDVQQYAKYAATTPAGTLGAITLVWTAPTIMTGASTTRPTITVTIPNARFDGETPNVSGAQLLTQTLSGPCLNSTSGNDALSIAIVTLDSTAL